MLGIHDGDDVRERTSVPKQYDDGKFGVFGPVRGENGVRLASQCGTVSKTVPPAPPGERTAVHPYRCVYVYRPVRYYSHDDSYRAASVSIKPISKLTASRLSRTRRTDGRRAKIERLHYYTGAGDGVSKLSGDNQYAG